MVDKDRLPLGWGKDAVPLHSYVSFYYSLEQTLRQSLAFIRAGLDEPGTFCVVLADPGRHATVVEELRGEDGSERLQRLLDAGKLAIVEPQPTFEQLAGAMLARMDQALAAGFERIRALGLVAWGQPGWPDLSALKQCEAQVNRVAASYPAVIVCAYNLPQLPGQAVAESDRGDAPLVIVNDRLDVS
jgi:DcmR-like sensory protein